MKRRSLDTVPLGPSDLSQLDRDKEGNDIDPSLSLDEWAIWRKRPRRTADQEEQ